MHKNKMVKYKNYQKNIRLSVCMKYLWDMFTIIVRTFRVYKCYRHTIVSILGPKRNGWNFAEDIFKCIFVS